MGDTLWWGTGAYMDRFSGDMHNTVSALLGTHLLTDSISAGSPVLTALMAAPV